MFEQKQYRVSATNADKKGKKTTITVSTNDENVVRRLLDSPKNNKDFMDANFKETKKSSSKDGKKKSTSTKTGEKKKIHAALPVPKASKPLVRQPQKKEAKPKAKKEASNKSKKIYTTSELRKKLRSLKPYSEELVLGKNVIVKTTHGYGIRSINDHDNPMTDYSSYTYGFKEKWILERARINGLLKD